MKNALIPVNNTISRNDSCMICESNINWYAPVDMEHEKLNQKIQAILEVNEPIIVSHQERWAEVDVIVNCPKCGIKNRFRKVKYQLPVKKERYW